MKLRSGTVVKNKKATKKKKKELPPPVAPTVVVERWYIGDTNYAPLWPILIARASVARLREILHSSDIMFRAHPEE